VKGIYRYKEYFGRMGSLSGIFVATDEEFEAALGKSVYLGEVLGKHSDITAEINEQTVTCLTAETQIVNFFEKYDLETGINPLDCLEPEEDYEDEDAYDED
jgi:hypothetical protein